MTTDTPSSHHETPSPSTASSLSPSTAVSPSILSTFAYPVSYTVSGLLRRISADEAPTPLARALSANYNGGMQEPSTLGGGGGGGVFHPPPTRRLSPFQPPPLTPLTLTGHRDSTAPSSRLLNKALAEEIRLLMPPRLQLVDTWRLVYGLEQDGTSLASLYGLCAAYRGKRGGFVLAVRDDRGGLFGAYLTDAPHPSPHYYGTGECFLWRCFRLPDHPDLSSLPPPPSEDTTNLARMTTIPSADLSPSSSSASLSSSSPPTESSTRNPSPSRCYREEPSLLDDDDDYGPLMSGTATPASSTVPSVRIAAANPLYHQHHHNHHHHQHQHHHHHHRTGHARRPSLPLRFKAFPYTGENEFTILCNPAFLSVGGGKSGRYGLWLDDRMARGVSGECETFGNEPLSEASGGKFGVLGVEVWYVGS